ncbi:unnamed protein product [Meloidogyne enterolobii]|uniref:Uncharacterized protein n=1 Tax=Meloidogyne enterolobii TaxID=390850 RepID=A0ACB0YXK4_MELEN
MFLFAKLTIPLFLFSQLPFICTTPTKKASTSEITQEASTSQIKVEQVDKQTDEEEILDKLFEHHVFSDENQKGLIKQIKKIKILHPIAMKYLVNYQQFTELCKFLHNQLTNKYHKNNISKDLPKGVPEKIKKFHVRLFKVRLARILVIRCGDHYLSDHYTLISSF